MAKYVKTEQGYKEYQEVEAANSNKMDANNPVGTGSFSMGRKSDSVIGNCSHAEGIQTISGSSDQHVQGKYNIEDSQGKYAHIVGNGTVEYARSNAHTLDWNGNAWYAGDIYTGSTSGVNKDEGSKKLATEEYVDASVVTDEHINELIDAKLIISSSTAGSTKKFKITVDDAGTLTAIEVI